MISQVQGETLLRHDARPPILYLRDFRNDAALPLNFRDDASARSDTIFTSAWLCLFIQEVLHELCIPEYAESSYALFLE